VPGEAPDTNMAIRDTLADFFEFEEHGTDLETELLAGLTTFLAMSYIVVVNPGILARTDLNPDVDGMQAAISPAGYAPGQVFQMVAIVTIISAVVATLVMAFYANRPFGQAPGLALNAFFAFTVVGAMGISWQTALAAIVVEGLVFILLTLVGARSYVVELFPEPVKVAVGTGIGLFLALIGLNEMQVVTGSSGTIVGLSDVAQDPVALLALAGLFLTLMLYARGVPGSIVIGIVATTLAAYGFEAVGVVDAGVLTPGALSSATYDISPLAGAFVEGRGDVEAASFALVVFTFFFVDFFDTAGTLTGVGQAANLLDDDGNLPEMEKPLMADAVGTTVGGALGTSTVTTYIESATGVEEGGRTGMTALTVALLFLLSLVFVPLAAGVPLYASHIALVVVGVIMLRNVGEILWSDLTYAIPAGMTILVMPFTYNIGYGIAAGIITYPLVKLGAGEVRDTHPAHWLLAAAFVVYFYVRTSGLLTTI
jgi:AGZA family xanthine/uracil permease-like MFS transporter